MSENDTDIEDLSPADLGTDLGDLDMEADLSDAELPDLEASDELLDPFVGDSLESDDALSDAGEQTLDDLPPDPGMLDDGPLMDDFEPDHLEEDNGELAEAPEVMAEEVPAATDEVETETEDEDEDLEPITLSEEELDNILGTGDDILVDLADADPDADGTPDDDDLTAPDPVVGEAPADEDFNVDLEATGDAGDDLDLGAGLDDISDETLTPLDEEDVPGEPSFEEEPGEEPVIMDDLPDEISDDISGEPADAAPAEGGEEDEGPVALSEAELDNILGDVDMSEPMDLGEDPGGLPGEDFSDVPDDIGAEPALAMDEGIEEDEEDITLSDDELSNVLLDTEELAETPAPAEDDLLGADDMAVEELPHDDLLGEPMDLDDAVIEEASLEELDGDADMGEEPAPSILDEDDDDEPVTLSMEELGNIVSDVDTEEAEDAVGLPPQEEIGLDDSLDAAPELDEAPDDDTPSILDEGEDEGPVALSEDELSNILEDVDEEQAEDIAAPMAETIEEKNIIVLDEYEELGDQPAEESVDDAPADDGMDLADAGALSDEELEAELDLAPEPEPEPAPEPTPDRSELVAATAADQQVDPGEVKKMISYLDRLFDQLPEDTIREFSKSEYFDLYKKIMGDLGLLK